LIVGIFLTTILLLADNPPRGICSKQFSLTTWNVGDVPQRPFATHRDANLDGWVKLWILNKNNYPDNITGIQEDWYGHIYEGTKSVYNWALTYSNGFPDFYGAISILSQFYIADHFFVRWIAGHGVDKTGEKGFAYSVICIQVTNSSGWTCQFPIHFYCLHAQSGDMISDLTDRIDQLNQLSNFMNSHSSGYSVIVAGDFNCNYTSESDPDIVRASDTYLLNRFMRENNLTMANDPAKYTHNSYKTLDFILFRSAKGDSRESLQLIDCNVRYEAAGSDHYPVKANFNFSINYDAYPDLVVSDILRFEYDPWAQEGIAYLKVKNNGPAASEKDTQVYVTISYQKWTYGLGFIPKLASGQSTIVEVYVPELNLDPFYDSYVFVNATANRPSIIKENDVLNNYLRKMVPVQFLY
jgi:hypothetical protein